MKPLTASHLGPYEFLAGPLAALLPDGISDYTCSQLGDMLAGGGTSPWGDGYDGLTSTSCGETVVAAANPLAFGSFCGPVEDGVSEGYGWADAGLGSFETLLKQVVSVCYNSCQNFDCGTIPLAGFGSAGDLRCAKSACEGENTLLSDDGATCTVGGNLGDTLNAALAGSAALDCAAVEALPESDRNDVCKGLIGCASGNLVPPRDCAICPLTYASHDDFPDAYSCGTSCLNGANGMECQNAGTPTGNYQDASDLSNCGCECAAGFFGDNCESVSGCVDDNNFVDSWNTGCANYYNLLPGASKDHDDDPTTPKVPIVNGDIGGECADYAVNGVTACTACCVCGGGTQDEHYQTDTSEGSIAAICVAAGQGPNVQGARRRLLSNWAKRQRQPIAPAKLSKAPAKLRKGPVRSRFITERVINLRNSYNAHGVLKKSKLGRPVYRSAPYYDAPYTLDGSTVTSSDASYNLEFELCHATQHVNINNALNGVVEPILGTGGFNADLVFAAESGNSGADEYTASDADGSSFGALLLQSALELSNNQVAVHSRTSAECTTGDLATVYSLAARYTHLSKCVAPQFEDVVENARTGNNFQCAKILKLNGNLAGDSLSLLTPERIYGRDESTKDSVLFAFDDAVKYFKNPGDSTATLNRIDELCGGAGSETIVPNKRADAPTASEIAQRSGNAGSFPLSTKCVSEFNNALYDIAQYLDASQTSLVKVDYTSGVANEPSNTAGALPEYAQIEYSTVFYDTHIAP